MARREGRLLPCGRGHTEDPEREEVEDGLARRAGSPSRPAAASPPAKGGGKEKCTTMLPGFYNDFITMLLGCYYDFTTNLLRLYYEMSKKLLRCYYDFATILQGLY